MNFKHYRFDTIRDLADRFRIKHWGDNIPIDIDSIIEFKLGLEIRPIKNLKSVHDVDGMLSKDLSVISVDSNMYSDSRFESRVRFTLAHEIGHLILHREFYEEVNFKSPQGWINIMNSINPTDLEWYERHANEFAGRLLVPIDSLESEVKAIEPEIVKLKKMAKLQGLEDESNKWVESAVANKISGKFMVSPKTIEIRIRREKLQL